MTFTLLVFVTIFSCLCHFFHCADTENNKTCLKCVLLNAGLLLSHQTEDEKLHPGKVQIGQEQLPTPHTGSTDPQGALHKCRGDVSGPVCVFITLRASRFPALLSHAATPLSHHQSCPPPDRQRAGSEGKYARGLSGVYGDIFRLFTHPQLSIRSQNSGLKTALLCTNHAGNVKSSVFLNPGIYGHVSGLCAKVALCGVKSIILTMNKCVVEKFG